MCDRVVLQWTFIIVGLYGGIFGLVKLKGAMSKKEDKGHAHTTTHAPAAPVHGSSRPDVDSEDFITWLEKEENAVELLNEVDK
jgi:hypothetical protein